MTNYKYKVGEILERNCPGGDYDEGYRFTVTGMRYYGAKVQYQDSNNSWHTEHCVKLFASKDGEILKCPKSDCPMKDDEYTLTYKDMVVGEKYMRKNPKKNYTYLGLLRADDDRIRVQEDGQSFSINVSTHTKFKKYEPITFKKVIAVIRNERDSYIGNSSVYNSEESLRDYYNSYMNGWTILKVLPIEYNSEVDG